MTRGRTRFPAEALERVSYFLDVLSGAGLNVLQREGQLLVHGESAHAIAIRTGAYPDFPSDLVPPLTAALTQARGDSVIEERVYAHRFDHLAALRSMGAAIEAQGNIARIGGPRKLTGRSVAGTGIRECAALVLAGLAAEGETIIQNAGAVDRGYEDLVGQLQSLGADVIWINRASAAA
jgi:UDP-N-acetylglucosamine 1-carboxyvinyltransferase